MPNKKRWVLFFIWVAPVTLAELSLYILARDIFTWGGLAVAVTAELVSVVLHLIIMRKTPEPESSLEPHSAPPVEQPRFVRWKGILEKIWLRMSTRIGIALLVLAVVANFMTVLNTSFGWWRWYSGAEVITTPGPSGVTTVQSTPTPVHTPASPLERRLLAATSVRVNSARDEAMRLVAKDAMDQDDYKTAIEAGRLSASSRGKSETLKFVALCAAKRGKFTVAFEAADHIPLTSVHDDTKIDILSMEEEQKNSDLNGREQRVACD